jgi:serine/threonine protein kinase
MSRCPSKALFGRKTHPTQNFLSKVAILYNSDLLNKDPSKRMSIKEVLDHSWIQKFTKNKVTDRRTSNDSNSSNFSLYTTINEESKSDKK